MIRLTVRGMIIGAFGVILATMLLCVQIFLAPKKEITHRRITSAAEMTAALVSVNVSAALSFRDLPTIKEVLSMALRDEDTRYVAVADVDGQVVVELGDKPEELDVRGNGQEVTGGYVVVRQRIKGSPSLLDDAQQTETLGTVLVAVSLERVEAETWRYTRALWGAGFLIVFIAIVVAMGLTSYVANPLTVLTHRVKRVARGDLDTPPTELRSSHEIRQLEVNINHMVTSLREVSADNDRERWFKGGQAEVSDTMRGEQALPTMCRNVITFLAKYTGAHVGTLFSKVGERLHLQASYAFQWRQHSSHEYALGEGVVGQAALEKQTIVVCDLPDDYMRINSSLGSTVPRHLVVMPVLLNDEVKGVIELGFLTQPSDMHLEFLALIAENVAVGINSCQDRERLKELVGETQRQSDELRAQQEQLEEANESLSAQAADLRASEEGLKEQSEQLQAANAELEEKTEFLEAQKRDIADKNSILEAAKQEIEAKAAELEIASKYKSEFLANMSHELRTPLNSMLILAKALADNDEGNLTEDQVKSAQIVHRGGNDLLRLINDILDLSKVEAGRLSVDLISTEVDDLLFGLHEQFLPDAQQKGVELRVESTLAGSSTVHTDSQRAQQILKNLLSNALKFTQSGSVTLRISEPEPGAKLGDLDPEQTIAFAVIDTGIGIPEDRQRAIFEAFQQADGSTSRKYGGTGLGLAISRELTRLLAGRLCLDSVPGQGSTFTLYLPRACTEAAGETVVTSEVVEKEPASSQLIAEPTAAPVPASPQPSVPHAPEDGQAKTVLVVEDDPTFAQTLMTLCKKQGYRCQTAADGVSGLLAAVETQPSAILLDLGLPDLPGLEVLEQLKHDLRTRHIPVHIVSGKDAPEDWRRRGALGFLKKPATATDITEALVATQRLSTQPIKEVLVVESSTEADDSIASLVANDYNRVTTVNAGAEALEACASKTFDCVVVDEPLADISLAELFNAMAEELVGPPPPMIVHTNTPPNELSELRGTVKAADSKASVLDETTLFLHSVEANLSEPQKRVIRMMHDPRRMLEGRKVLLVDDDLRNTFALAKVLRAEGLSVVIADNGELGLEKLDSDPTIELVLMDIMMPVMDGYEAMRRIRKDPRFADLPIVAVTAKAMAEDRTKCLAAGANDYITKPVNTDKLKSLIQIWLYRAA